MADPDAPILKAMYVFLIEAGGLKQMARIHPGWRERFLSELDKLLRSSGFCTRRTDGDLLFCEQTSSQDPDASIIVDTVYSIMSFLQGHVEILLDYSIILDYAAERHRRDGEITLERHLRDIRTGNSFYITDAVVSALDPLVQTEKEGGLHRVRSFGRERWSETPSYRDAVCCHDRSEDLRERVATVHELRWMRVWGSDRGVVTATVQNALCRNGVPPITVQCRPRMTRTGFERALIQALPDLPVHTGSDADDALERVIAALRSRMSDPAGAYLSYGAFPGDLGFVARQSFGNFVRSESRRSLFIADYDLCDDSVPDLPSWIPETILGGPVLVSSCSPVDDDRWYSYCIDSGDTAQLPGNTAHTSIAYWCGISSDRSSSAPGDTPPASNNTPSAPGWGAFESGSVPTDSSGARLEAAGRALRRALGPVHRRVLAAIRQGEALLGSSAENAIFRALQISPVERSRILSELARVGLIGDRDRISLHPYLDDLIAYIVTPEETRPIVEALARCVAGDVVAGKVYPAPPLWPLVRDNAPSRERTFFFHRLVYNLASSGAIIDSDTFPAAMDFDLCSKTAVAGARVQRFLYGHAEPSESTLSDEIQALERRITAGVDDTDPCRAYSGDYALSLAGYHLWRRDHAQALTYSKSAILVSQSERQRHSLERSRNGASQLMMARINLFRNQFKDASLYVAFARDEAGTDTETALAARVLGAILSFLYGNLTRAAAHLEALVEDLAREGFTEYLLLNWFTTARIRYELGDYARARSVFALVSLFAERSGREQTAVTATAWRLRSELQLDPGDESARAALSDGPATAERIFFLAEALCRCEDTRNALPLLKEAEEMEAREDRRPGLNVCWDNGFAPLEDLVIADRPGETQLLRQVRAYRAWALGKTGAVDEAVDIFFALTRGNGKSTADPYSGLYHYLYASILSTNRSSDWDDANTVLGKAVKLVQERSRRMDDAQDKRHFLRNNTWNSRLIAAAGSVNLM